MDELIHSNSLYHYTNKDALIKILTTKCFLTSYCLEDFSWLNKSIPVDKIFHRNEVNQSDKFIDVYVPMVCFCDILEKDSKKHSDLYGKYALVMKKEWALKNNISPVTYIHNNSL